jgi:hypothetical protein
VNVECFEISAADYPFGKSIHVSGLQAVSLPTITCVQTMLSSVYQWHMKIKWSTYSSLVGTGVELRDVIETDGFSIYPF